MALIRFLTYLLIVLIGWAVTACQPIASQPSATASPSVATTSFDPTQTTVELSRGGCKGACPVYYIVISPDGSIRYEGQAYVEVMGVREATIEAETVHALVQEILDADFEAMRDLYNGCDEQGTCIPAWDLPSLSITLRDGNHRKQVTTYYVDSPERLDALGERIDDVAGTWQWVGEP